MQLKIISAGAGSGKTYRLTSEMVGLLASGEVRASGIIATTFTKKAAAELQERVRVRLLEDGLTKEANDLANALIGTVHGLGVKLLKRFAFEAGVSPDVDIIADEDQQVMFNQSLAMVLTHERVEEMERLADRLGLNKSEIFKTDWRKVLKDLTEVARANDFSFETLDNSKELSFQTFIDFLKPAENENGKVDGMSANFTTREDWKEALSRHLEEAIVGLENNGDTTKVTADGVKSLRELQMELNFRGELFWYQWAKISKTRVGAKSRDDIAPLADFANEHIRHPGFRKDIQDFIFNIFDTAKEAIEEYARYKKHRGLIDYTDMEVLVKNLLDNESVQAVLKEELDLLMVDEFQDTSPIQLEIFLKLSRFARHSIWVGDPKQSIYGFRGAEPALMEAIIKNEGGLKKGNILSHSWRSREDIVFASNAIFTKAFSHLPVEQVALEPKRRRLATPDSANMENEPEEMEEALRHWSFTYDGEGRQPNKEWLHHCIATTLSTELERGLMILPKREKGYRHALPGDVAILCRSNNECRDVAGALHKAGLRAAISRAGLLGTAESKLVLACLKFILNKHDNLSIAEILLLAARLGIEEIIEDRLEYLDKSENERPDYKWGEHNEFIQRLNLLRPQVVELSGAEILTLLLEELDLRRIIVSWGNVEQRLANVDVLCSLALKYEEACNRLHSAASLGGFLLWLNDLENGGADLQGSGESPEAVNVLTYHRSKGLEYPVLICHSLENQLRADVWGISIVPEKEEVDLDNLLGNRWLRFWVNPYADQSRGTLLIDRIEESTAKAVKLREALEEEARLMYVGITRARDYLIFPTRQKPPVWLNRVCNNGSEDQPALDAGSSESYWEWAGKTLDIKTVSLPFPNDFPHAGPSNERISFLEKRAGRAFHPLFVFEPARSHENGGISVRISEEMDYASPLPLPEVQERTTVAKAVQAYLTADNDSYEVADRQVMEKELLKRFDVSGFLEPGALMKTSDAFAGVLENRFKINKIHRRFPISAFIKGQFFETTIDLVLETEGGLILVVNSLFIGDGKNRQKKINEIAATMHFCKVAASEFFDMVSIETWIHFILYGKLVRVDVT